MQTFLIYQGIFKHFLKSTDKLFTQPTETPIRVILFLEFIRIHVIYMF